MPKWEPQRRLKAERVKGLGGKKVGGESCRTCPQGGLGSINKGATAASLPCDRGQNCISGKSSSAQGIGGKGLPRADYGKDRLRKGKLGVIAFPRNTDREPRLLESSLDQPRPAEVLHAIGRHFNFVFQVMGTSR